MVSESPKNLEDKPLLGESVKSNYLTISMKPNQEHHDSPCNCRKTLFVDHEWASQRQSISGTCSSILDCCAALIFFSVIVILVLYFIKPSPCPTDLSSQNISESLVPNLNQTTLTKSIKSASHTFKPCDDYYEYACAEWNEKHSLPDNFTTIYTGYEVIDQIYADLKTVLETNSSRIENKFYRMCMNRENDNSFDHQPLMDLLERSLGHSWPILNDLNETKIDQLQFENLLVELNLLNMNRLINIKFEPNQEGKRRPYFSFNIFDTWFLYGEEFKSLSSLIVNRTGVKLNQSELDIQADELNLMINRTFDAWLKYDDGSYQPNSMTLGQFKNASGGLFDWTRLLNQMVRRSMVQFLLLIGHLDDGNQLTDNELVQQTEHILKLIYDMTSHHNTTDSKLVASLPYLSQYIDNFHLGLIKLANNSEAIRINFYTDEDEVLVRNLDFLRIVYSQFSKASPRVIYNMFGWSFVLNWYIEAPQIQLYNLFTYNITEYNEGKPSWQKCVTQTMQIFPIATVHQYLTRFFDHRIKSKVTEMANNIRNTLAEIIEQQYDWLDNSTRTSALEKLKSMKQFIAFPDWIMNDYQWLSTANYQSNETMLDIIVSKNVFDFTWKVLTTAIDRPVEDFDFWAKVKVGFEMNSFYLPYQNAIFIPFSILLRTFDVNSPEAHNYGSTGFIIAHEIIHGLNPFRFYRDKSNTLNDWWTDKASDRFREKANCFIKLYSNITEPITMRKLDGRNSIEENISDNGAVHLAYNAFKRYDSERNNSTHNTTELSFFVQFAQHLCAQNGRPLFMDSEHIPFKYRVNVPLANFDQFSSLYKCPLDSPMNPKNKCTLW